MLKNKVKELLKNKKVLSVCAFVVVAVGLAGAIVALSSSSTSVPEVSKADEVSNKQDNSKDNKKEENKKSDNKKEDSKKEDIKKEENNNSPVEDKEVDTHANEEGGAQTLAVANAGNTQDTNLDSSSGSTSNTDSSSSVSNSSSSNTSNASSTVAPSEPSHDHDHDHTHDHVHNWVPITQQITHPEEGYWADELVSGAWTEEIPVYEERAREICNGCGLDITEDPWAHIDEQLDLGNYNCMGYHTEYRQFQVGTNTVQHDAIYSKKWIVSSPAWVETVTTGYQCSDCGATK